MRKLFYLLCFLATLTLISLVTAQETPDEPDFEPPPQNYAFIFDASGSMRAGLAGRTRLAVAHDAIVQLSQELEANINASLWVYGHRLPQDDVAASCRDIEQVIPLSPVDPAEFERIVRNIQAIGYTPISDSISQAAASLPVGGNNTIILISDGEETCAGDPCAVARQLAENDVNLVVNTIGFAVNDFTRQQLECIAEVTGGVYLDAPGPEELTNALNLVTKLPGSIRIVDQNGDALPQVPFSITRAGGGKLGNFNGSASIPAGDYTVDVQSDPAISQQVTIISAEVTEIVVQVVSLGAIVLVDGDGARLNDVAYSVTNAATGEFLGQRTGEFTLSAGEYDVEVRVRVGVEQTEAAINERVTVKEDEVTPVLVDFPSGMIRMVNSDGELVSGFVTTISRQDTGEFLYSSRDAEFTVPPGDYRVLVYDLTTFEVDVTIERDEVVDIVIETRRGVIVPVDEDGNPTEATFQITRIETQDLVYFQRLNAFDVPPGTYRVIIREFGGYETEVTVEANETVEIPVVTARGFIVPVDEDGNPTEATFQINNVSTNELLYVQQQNAFEVPPGTYRVIVREFGGYETEVTVESGETVEVPVVTARGFIVPVDEDGNPTPATFQVNNATTNELLYYFRALEFEVPPGRYRVVVREFGGYETEVTVRGGETVEVPVVTARGFIVPVDEDGNPTPATLQINDVTTNELLYFVRDNSFEVPPGTYRVIVQEIVPYEMQVTVEGEETVEIAIVTARGVIVPVDRNGNPVQATLQITDSATGRNVYFVRDDSFEVPPGRYEVTTHDGERYTTQVTIAEDETVNIEIR